jgi:hypothetical protein
MPIGQRGTGFARSQMQAPLNRRALHIVAFRNDRSAIGQNSTIQVPRITHSTLLGVKAGESDQALIREAYERRVASQTQVDVCRGGA